MTSKTLQFDKALDEILKNLKPHDRICLQCGSTFHIFQEDIDFYHILKVPPPKLCLACRKQRRMAMMPNTFQFYKKKCSDHPEEIVVSLFGPNDPHKIFDNKFWWDPDKWDALDYGTDYDSSRPFFEQLHNLLLKVPHFAIQRYAKNVINSEYATDAVDVKDCYMLSTAGWCQNVSYTFLAVRSRDCFDAASIDKCELSYELIDCTNCYESIFLQNCMNCIKSAFLFDCRNCQNCFGSVNLRNKQYYFFNKPLTKEAYEEEVSKINLGNRTTFLYYQQKFEELIKNAIHKHLYNSKEINSLGDRLKNCKDCFQSFVGIDSSERVRYSDEFIQAKDTMDGYIIGPGERGYNTVEVFMGSDIKCSYFTGNCMSIEYCFECMDCKYCFGCVGLKKKQYCIFNKQYSEEEYWRKLDEIKTKMLNDGIYGEYLPLPYALYYYNDTYAQVEFPLSKESAEKIGARWHEEEMKSSNIGNIDILKTPEEVPDDIKDVDDDILEKAILCEVTKKPFRIIKAELEFYRQRNLPLPTKHPQQRLFERLKKRNPYKLWQYPCTKCGRLMFTSYSPEKKFKVYCKECYLEEVL